MKKLISLIIIINLFSCAQGKLDPLDEKVGLRKTDFDKYLIKDRAEKDEKSEKKSAIPRLASLDIKPPKPVNDRDILNSHKTISFSITDETSLKDVLIELGRAAQIDVNIDPKISGGIVLSAYNRPLGEVVERICDLGNLRYSYKNGVLTFETDSAYLKNYFVDYLIEGSELWSDVQANLDSIIDSSVGATANSKITVNKSAGILSVFASQRQHGKIEGYLKDVERSASAQVLIEAKVVEVKLNDEYKTGINWNFVDANQGLSRVSDLNINGGFTAAQPLQFILSDQVDISVSALEKFGTTRTLSSPRVHAINNKKATLDFSNKLIYFELQRSTTSASNGVGATTLADNLTSTIKEEDVGVKLVITPSINIITGEVTLSIQPTITIQSGDVLDPASPRDETTGEIIAENRVPIIQNRKIDTIAKIQSGNVIVIGGLMQEGTIDSDIGIPFLQRIPILGNLFKSVSKVSEITETVIFIKATIVNSSSQVDQVDRELQEKFDTNRREFF